MQEVSHTLEVLPDKVVSTFLLLPEQARAILSLGHGAGSHLRHETMEQIARALAAVGVATFRYNFPFRERGGGRDSDAVSIATVQAAAAEAHRLAPHLTLLAGGHSFGGRMTSLAAAEGFAAPVKQLVFFAFPLHAPGKAGIERAAHLAKITVPMLFLSGTRDTFALPELLTSVVAPLPLAHLHWIEGADHGYKLPAALKKDRNVFSEMAAEVRKRLEA
ncbi:MAG: alpha/beta hydrolase [Bacteroidetes bacterium]|nr:MAG: alpha/beta hydrolase [Bacteroidota bacterium]